MSHAEEHDFDPRLVDYHLGRLNADERAALEREIAGDARLADEHHTLAQAFRALQSLPAGEPPSDLNRRIMARVAAAGEAPRLKTRRSP
ncbi:MAG: hypothetical protein D6744_10510, partial [Planctomycetota bacterium]